MKKNILDDVMIISEVAEAIGTTTANIRDLILRERIPAFYYQLKKAEKDKKGIYIFKKSFIEYHEKNLKANK